MLQVPDLQVLQICRFLQIAGFSSYCFNMSDGFNQIVNEKLEKNNYPAWKFKMTNFLKGKGYWDYVDGDNAAAPETPERNATASRAKCYSRAEKGLEGMATRPE